MIKAKVYDTYYPYLKSGIPLEEQDSNLYAPNGNGYGINEENKGEGIEYCLDNTEEQIIDYDNYYHSSFDLFWNNILNRFEQYKNINTTINFNLAEKKNIFQNILLAIYREQKLNKISNPYYCYVDMLSQDFKKKCTADNSNIPSDLNLNISLDLLEFLINQNLYIQPVYVLTSDTSVQSNVSYYTKGSDGISYKLEEDLEVFQSGVEYFILDNCHIENVLDSNYEIIKNSYKDVKFYMGIDEFEDLNGQVVQKFHYYEFKLKTRKIQHRIKQLRIDAPIGTTFYLNRTLHPITVYQYQNPFIKDEVKGYYTIEPEDYISIKYITFPKNAIIKYATKINPNWTSNMSWNELAISTTPTDWCLTVSYTYDDDYDIEYVDE